MGRFLDGFAKFVLIMKLVGWAMFGLSIFAVRYVKSKVLKNKTKPQAPLALKVLVETTLAKDELVRELDPYRSKDGDSANIRALRYL